VSKSPRECTCTPAGRVEFKRQAKRIEIGEIRTLDITIRR